MRKTARDRLFQRNAKTIGYGFDVCDFKVRVIEKSEGNVVITME